jgi:hypothetical protein
LTKLDISSNSLRVEGTTLLAAALKSNQGMTELNISSNAVAMYGDTSGVAALADVIPGMRAMTKLIFGGDGTYYDRDDRRQQHEPATLEVGMTSANFTNKGLGAGGAIIISAWMTHKDNGAMTSLNLASNRLCGIDESMVHGDGEHDASGTAYSLSCLT